MNQMELFRSSGHMRDLMLNKSDENETTPVFDTLRKETKELIQKKSVSIDLINQRGVRIKLSGSEWKMIDVLCELLHEQSINNNEPKENDFYTSRHGEETILYGGIKAPTERLIFTLYEITKKYKGEKERPSGKDIQIVEKILREWDSNLEKRVLIKYLRETIKPDKSKVIYKIETFQPLIQIAQENMTKYDPNGNEIESSNETVILLNPIFRDQIETKYINYPIGLNKRMIEAWGGHDIPEITFKLRDYLAREYSSKRFKCEIGLEKLYWQLSEKCVKQRNKKRIQTYLEKSVEAMKRLGLLNEYLLETNKKGEPKAVFILNENWI
jgi:hypothetical protein